MRLDRAVFLVAPPSRQPTMPTRRAVLGMGFAFTCGCAVGTACGYAAGRAADDLPADPPAEPPPADPVREPIVDAELAEMRRLAVSAPIEELMAQSNVFLALRNRQYPDDEILWMGVQRICDGILADENLANRRLNAMFVLQVIESNSPPPHLDFGRRIEALRRLR